MPIKVVIIGPESTGKSTLAAGLAEHFKEPWVKEYAREYIEKLNRPYHFDDLLTIGKGQVALEEEMEKKARKYLFCDTDLHVLKIWSQHKFGETHEWTLDQISKRTYHLYLLTDIDIAWEDDPQREHPDPAMRRYFMEQYLEEINNTGRPCFIMSGSLITRLNKAVSIIQEYNDEEN